MKNQLSHNSAIIDDVKTLIEQSREQVAIAVNATITMLYWQVGKRINEEILQDSRADYGKSVILTLSEQLTLDYGRGWSKKHLWHCVKFAQIFGDKEIIYTLCRQLSWSHLRLIFYMDDPLKREFYIEICKLEKWTVRTFSERIKSMLYERTLISKKPEETIKNDLELLRDTQQITPDLVFRDPYFLDFLGLKDSYSEKDLETAILAELQHFIIELGQDFAFLARQKRIIIDNRDYWIDLLFYHRRLKGLVVIDLKIGEFDAAYKGEMELYLSYMEKHETIEGENPPIGLILCTGKNPEHIELMHLEASNIKVAEYLTILPPKEILIKKLRRAIQIAQNKISGEEI